MYTGSFIVYVKTDDFQEDIGEDIETVFDTSNYELDKQLPKGKIVKLVRLMKNELGEKIKIKFLGLRVKSYNYLIDDSSDDKKAKSTKKGVIKRKLKF